MRESPSSLLPVFSFLFRFPSVVGREHLLFILAFTFVKSNLAQEIVINDPGLQESLSKVKGYHHSFLMHIMDAPEWRARP